MSHAENALHRGVYDAQNYPSKEDGRDDGRGQLEIQTLVQVSSNRRPNHQSNKAQQYAECKLILLSNN